jgi:6-phosphogluconolactonase
VTKSAPNCEWHEFETPGKLADVLADRVTDKLRRAIASRGQALLTVSGGTTPLQFFQALSKRDLDWSRITVTLVDERFVAPSSERSNERLVRLSLLQHQAAAARFVGFFAAAATVEEAARAAAESLYGLPFPPDVVILGMGSDGHTASFFPDADNLRRLLDPATTDLVLPVHAKSAGEPRLTLTLARLVEAGFVALHIEGDDKKGVLTSALQHDSGDLPVRAVFDQSPRPVQVFWAPSKE